MKKQTRTKRRKSRQKSVFLSTWKLLTVAFFSIFAVIVVIHPSIAAPGAPTLFNNDSGNSQIAFNNVRMNDTTPLFRVSATNVSSFNRFQLELNTASDFSGTAHTQTFSGSYTSGTEYNIQTTSTLGLPTTDNVTYFVRVRASDDGGSSWGSWSAGTWTYTYKSASEGPDWLQTTDEQFDTGTLVGTETSGGNSVQITGAGTTVPSNPYARYRASELGLADNASVTSWSDEGSGGYDLSNGTTAPTYKVSAGINGHPSVLFDSTNDSLVTASYSSALSQPNTIAVVMEYTAEGTESYAYDGNASGRHALINNPSLSSEWRGFAGNVVNMGGAPGTGTIYNLVTIFNGASAEHYVNNSLTSGALNIGNQSLNGFTLGNRFSQDSNSGASYYIAEALIYDRTLDSTERSDLQSYFTERYSAASIAGTIMSDPTRFDSYTAADSWDSFTWSEDETDGSLMTQLFYSNSTTCDTLIPDGDLAGNSTGFTSGPIDISGLNTSTYSELCLQSSFTNFGGSPVLGDWDISWTSTNDAPGSPSTLLQRKTDNTNLTVGAATNQNSVKFTANVSDADNPETLQLCVEARPVGVSFTNTETSCGSGIAESSTPVTATVTIGSLIEDTGYHWQARVKDAAGAYSSWVSFGSNLESAADFIINAHAPPTGGGSNNGNSGSGGTGSTPSSNITYEDIPNETTEVDDTIQDDEVTNQPDNSYNSPGDNTDNENSSPQNEDETVSDQVNLLMILIIGTTVALAAGFVYFLSIRQVR